MCGQLYRVEVSWIVPAEGMTGVPLAVDNCTSPGDIAYSFSDVTTQTSSGCGQYEYTITRTWTASRCLWQRSQLCTNRSNVVDTTPPTITCPPTAKYRLFTGIY